MKEKLYRCEYCYFNSPSLSKIKQHEEAQHGCFRDINPRKPKAKKPKSGVRRKAPEGKDIVVFPTGGVCKWNGYRYIDITNKIAKYPLNEDEPDRVDMGDGSTKFKCKNCGRYIKFLLDAFKGVGKNALPLVLCPSCGFNIFKDNRLRTYEWLIKRVDRKLPDAMDYDVMMSAVKDLGIIKRGKVDEIL